MIRQGDVLLVPTQQPQSRLTQALRSWRGWVLAEGEQTGHAHVIDSDLASLFHDKELAKRFLRVDAPVDLTHEEHNAITVQPGWYEVRIQRQFDPTRRTARAVND